MLELPDALRDDLKDPMGPVHTDPGVLLDAVEGPLVAVGDVVTYHLERAGRTPDVAIVDDKTQREAAPADIRDALRGADTEVDNPPATLTRDLMTAIRSALDSPEPVRIRVDGEEDLAVLPALLAAPTGASVVYGQPGEGMVHVRVTAESQRAARGLLERMTGDTDAALSLLRPDDAA